MMWWIFRELSKRVLISLCLSLTLKVDHEERLCFQDYWIRLHVLMVLFQRMEIREYFCNVDQILQRRQNI